VSRPLDMTEVPIIMPQLGESIAEATVVRLLVQVGDLVEAEQEIIEVETSKAVMGVTTPCEGKIASLAAETGQTYPIGSVLGQIETDAPQEATWTPLGPVETVAPSLAPTSSNGGEGLRVPVVRTGGSLVSPRVRARLDEAGLHASELELIPGSGHAGRVTIRDIEEYLEKLDQAPSQKCSALRLGVANSMRRSWSRPLATLGVGLDLENLLAHRKHQPVKAGPALYLARALGLALAGNPSWAGKILGNRLILPASIDVGIAVEVEDGVMVPVLRQIDQQSLIQLAQRYPELLASAQARRLPPEMQGDAVASVTNYGPLGVTWATPIPLPSETLIVGLGRGEIRPAWDEGSQSFVPRRQAELTITFDHRVLDGGSAGRLVQKLMALLTAPESL
jgi:pyruvate/2-oxoglutarate dehydrogenase complex dihydrolipoamide acyltransferase (E2) component